MYVFMYMYILVGIYNFESDELLEPQFKYIITDTTNMSYGFHNNSLLKIESNFKIDYEDHYALMHVLPKFNFQGKSEAFQGFLIYNYSDAEVILKGFDNYDKNLIITPSFLSKNNLLSAVIGNLQIIHGEGAFAKIIDQKKTNKGLFSAILEFYDGTFDVRDIPPSTVEAVSFTIENNNPDFKTITRADDLNGGKYVTIKNDSILENAITDGYLNLDPTYRYLK